MYKLTVSGDFSDTDFYETDFPTPNFPIPNFSTTTFSDGKIFRQTNFSEKLIYIININKNYTQQIKYADLYV